LNVLKHVNADDKCSITLFNRFHYLLTDSQFGVCDSPRMNTGWNFITFDRRQCLSAILLGLCIPVSGILAQETAADVPTTGSTIECAVSSNDTPVEGMPLCEDLYPSHTYKAQSGPWSFGLGAGYGQRSNPLINSDNVPVYAIVQLSYFGERFFFDNGDFGWRLADLEKYSVNAIAGVGGERSFYSFLNKSPVSILDSGELLTPGLPEQPIDSAVERPEAPDRDFAIDGGLEAFYEGAHFDLQLQALTDISNKHNGQQLWVSAGRSLRVGRLQLEPSAGFTWLSGKTANYYYGVRASEATPGLSAYNANHALNPFVRLSVSYPLSDHWQLVATGQYEFLDDEIADSSSVADDHVSTIFAGLYYEF